MFYFGMLLVLVRALAQLNGTARAIEFELKIVNSKKQCKQTTNKR